MIKLIATDIDGTLVPDGSSEINPEYFDVIRALKEKDILFVAASGRQYNSIENLFMPVKNDIIFAAENGSYVTCRGYDVLANCMDREGVQELIQDIRAIPDCEVVYCTPQMTYVETKDEFLLNWMIHGYHVKLTQVSDLLMVDKDAIKISVFHRTDATGAVGEAFFEKWQGRFQLVCAGKEWVDCMSVTSGKGNALAGIKKHMGIKTEETMAFGDNLNDMTMLQEAYYSYAIGNAREEVREAARFVADTNVNDGVLKELKKLL